MVDIAVHDIVDLKIDREIFEKPSGKTFTVIHVTLTDRHGKKTTVRSFMEPDAKAIDFPISTKHTKA